MSEELNKKRKRVLTELADVLNRHYAGDKMDEAVIVAMNLIICLLVSAIDEEHLEGVCERLAREVKAGILMNWEARKQAECKAALHGEVIPIAADAIDPGSERLDGM